MINLQNQKNLLLFASVICLLIVSLVLVKTSSFQAFSRYLSKSNSTVELDDDFVSRIQNASNAELVKVIKNSSIALQKNRTKDSLNRLENITLVVIISTAPERSQRRERIRKTYWKHCYNNSEVSSS